MKKVGLVTCFLDNYGACLQAYALSRVIEELGNQCTILKYTEPEGYRSHKGIDRLKDSRAYNTLRCILSEKYRTSYKLGKIRRKAFEAFRASFLPLSDTEYTTYSELIPAPEYDAFVCGSDQIWNPTFYGKCNPAYYLDFVPDAIPKIAYAPSIALADIPAMYTEDFSRYLQRFHAVSVREQNGVGLVKEYANREAKWVLDPTMLLDGEQWSRITKDSIYKKPYIFCYLFGTQEYYKAAIEHLRTVTGYDVVIIPFSARDLAKDYHKIYKAGPVEFITLIKNAAYVLTDSFHATVFSILFGRSFYTLLRNADDEITNMNSRIYSLLSMVGKEERCVDKAHVSDYEIKPVADYQEVWEKLGAVRKESMEFLKSALEELPNEG